jgi:hypothetical protein
VTLVRAQLVELDPEFEGPLTGADERRLDVQFNPESLKVTYANQLATPKQTGDVSGPASHQFVGASSTKLALTLWFDVGVPPYSDDPKADVRRLTQNVTAFMIAKPPPPGSQGRGGDGKAATENQLVPPAVRFVWGSFQFDGTIESLDETLEFFAPDGRPLRASCNLSMTKPSISAEFIRQQAGAGDAGVGSRPLAAAGVGVSLQGMAAAAGAGASWQAIAAANGIENPRRMVPGQLIDLRARAQVG